VRNSQKGGRHGIAKKRGPEATASFASHNIHSCARAMGLSLNKPTHILSRKAEACVAELLRGGWSLWKSFKTSLGTGLGHSVAHSSLDHSSLH